MDDMDDNKFDDFFEEKENNDDNILNSNILNNNAYNDNQTNDTDYNLLNTSTTDINDNTSNYDNEIDKTIYNDYDKTDDTDYNLLNTSTIDINDNIGNYDNEINKTIHNDYDKTNDTDYNLLNTSTIDINDNTGNYDNEINKTIHNDYDKTNDSIHNKNRSKQTKRKKNKFDIKIIIAIIVILLVVVLLIVRCTNKSDSYNGYTAGIGEKLVVKEKINNFSIEVISPLEQVKYTDDINHLDYNKEYAKLGIRFENIDGESLLLVSFTLVDNNKQVLAKLSPMTPYQDDLTTNKLSEKGSKEGSLYFNNDYEDTLNPSIITYSKYLKVSVPASASKNGTEIYYEDYYLTIR